MRLLISILILFSSITVFAQLQIDMKSANQKYERAFLDVHELKQLLSITTEVSTSELAQRFADFLYTSPLTVRGMGGSYPDEKGGKHIYRMHPALQIDEPMNEYFLLAYVEFFKKEVETIVALAPKILPYSQSPGGHKEYKIRESVYGCLQTMAIDTTVEDCLNEWRPHLVKDQNVLSTFISSYIRLYRASRLYFANYKPVDIQGLPSGLVNLCPYITGKYLELENKKAEFLTKRSWWSGLEQFYVYNTFPELFYIAGSSFSFSLAPKEVPTGDRGLRFLCTVPQYMFSKMNMRN